jgi:DNA-binding MarR family transcriptional regulator
MATLQEHETELQPLADLDRIIHSPARLMIMTYLYVVESADYTFLLQLTGLTWGNLATHLGKLEEAGYVRVEKEFVGKKPHSMVHLTEAGQTAFQAYKRSMQEVLNKLPD